MFHPSALSLEPISERFIVNYFAVFLAVLVVVTPGFSIDYDPLVRYILVPGEYPTIQAGIDAAVHGDTVLIADGTYTGDGNRDIDFQGKAITVMSENGPEKTVIDCEGSEEDPHRGFYFFNDEGLDSRLTGFTIKNGFTDIYGHGGGIRCEYSSPTITNCIITKNTAYYSSGGISLSHSQAVIANCIISSNIANSGGGAIQCYYSDAEISHCTISFNEADLEKGGGGIYCYISEPVITNCIV